MRLHQSELIAISAIYGLTINTLYVTNVSLLAKG